MSYFIFKGINSKEHVTLERIPLTTRPERVTQVIEIPGGEPIIYETGTYKTVPVTLQLGIKDTSVSHMDFLNEWLSGTGEIIFSNDPDRYQIAVCNGNLTGNRIARSLGKMPVSFTFMPFKYSIQNEWQTINLISGDGGDKHAWIPYEGTQESLPSVKIYCNGKMHLQWGQTGIDIENVSDHVIIDVPTRRVYDKNGNIILNQTVGNIKDITLVNNRYILVNSNVSKVEILPNTRWKS